MDAISIEISTNHETNNDFFIWFQLQILHTNIATSPNILLDILVLLRVVMKRIDHLCAIAWIRSKCYLVKALNEFQLPAFDLNDEQRHDFIICIGFVFSQYFKKIQIIIFELVTQLTMGARYLL